MVCKFNNISNASSDTKQIKMIEYRPIFFVENNPNITYKKIGIFRTTSSHPIFSLLIAPYIMDNTIRKVIEFVKLKLKQNTSKLTIKIFGLMLKCIV
tara:strand:+ start:1238 stop:1528 length:291 start_codon:yes stop_codon:yes gene_type:complete